MLFITLNIMVVFTLLLYGNGPAVLLECNLTPPVNGLETPLCFISVSDQFSPAAVSAATTAAATASPPAAASPTTDPLQCPSSGTHPCFLHCLLF